MTYFLAIAAPLEPSQIQDAMGNDIYLEDASGSPIGSATLGGNDGAVMLVNAGHGATHIVSQRHDADRRVVAGVRALLEETPSVSVLLHLARGVVLQEPIPDRGRRRITFHDFAELFPKLEEDVRFAVVNS